MGSFHKKKNVSFNFGQTTQHKNSCPDISSHCMATDEFAGFMVDAHKLAVNIGFKMAVFPSLMIGNCGAVNVTILFYITDVFIEFPFLKFIQLNIE